MNKFGINVYEYNTEIIDGVYKTKKMAQVINSIKYSKFTYCNNINIIFKSRILNRTCFGIKLRRIDKKI